MESPTVKEKEDGYAGQGSLSPIQALLPTIPDSPIRESDNSYAAGHPEQPGDLLATLIHKPVVSEPSTYTAGQLLRYPQHSSRSFDQHTLPAFGYFPHHPAFERNSYNHAAGYQQAFPGLALAQNPYNHAPANPQTVSRYLQAAPGYPQSAPGYSAQYHQQPTSDNEYSPHRPGLLNQQLTSGIEYSPHRPGLANQQLTSGIEYSPHHPGLPNQQLTSGIEYSPHRSGLPNQQLTSGIEYSPHRPGLPNQFSGPIYPTVYPTPHPNFAHQSIPNYDGRNARKQEALAKRAKKRSVKHLTCYYWYRKAPCKWTEDQCAYAHVWTGKLADKPLTLEPGRK